MHFFSEPVEMTVDRRGEPVEFVWRRRRYRVKRVQASWAIGRKWWRDRDLEPPLDDWLYRVAAVSERGDGVVELRESKGNWRLERMWS